MKQPISLTLLIIISLYCGYYLYKSDLIMNQSNQIEEMDSRPFFYGDTVFNTRYNKKGVRNYTIASPYAEYYDQKKETKFTFPVMYTFDTDGITKKWRFRANHGVLDDNILTLTGHVRAYNLQVDVNIEAIQTEQLFININTDDYWSNVPAQINGQGYQNSGNTVKGNIKTDEITLINSARGRYEKKSTQIN